MSGADPVLVGVRPMGDDPPALPALPFDLPVPPSPIPAPIPDAPRSAFGALSPSLGVLGAPPTLGAQVLDAQREQRALDERRELLDELMLANNYLVERALNGLGVGAGLALFVAAVRWATAPTPTRAA